MQQLLNSIPSIALSPFTGESHMKNMPSFYLTTKDHLMLNYLLKVRVADIHQATRANGGKARQYLLERLNKLASEGYVQKDWFQAKIVYSLGRKGMSFFHEQGTLLKEFKTGFLGFKYSQVDHDLRLTDIYYQLEQIKEVSNIRTHNHQIIYEREPDGCYNIPDCRFTVHKNGKEYQLALELELSRKNIKEYSLIFDLYRRDENTAMVLYLVSDARFKNELLNIDRTVFGEERVKIYIGLINEFEISPLTAQFISCHGKVFTFDSLVAHPRYEAETEQKTN